MTRPDAIHWCETYLTSWEGNARPLSWNWKLDPDTNERILYCGSQVIREKDCKLTLDVTVKS